jgi:hypothetical protein
VFLFGKSEGSIFVEETDSSTIDCTPAVQCAAHWQGLMGGRVNEVMINGLTYQHHDDTADWNGKRQYYYVDWNDRTYTFTITFPHEPEVIESIMNSVVWQE